MQRVGQYELREELGRGGLGQVWRAWDPGLRREVALKLLLREPWQLSPEERERFAREGEAQARVRDPGLAEVYALDLRANPPYLVMELVPGHTLAAQLRRGPSSLPQALRLTLELARTLSRLHRAGVVHRDLKPQNVMIRPDGQPVLLDLGLAQLLDRSARMTQSGEILGTPGYLAPEQASGQAGRMGPAADVYGLGATLFALLTGGPPFPGSGLPALAATISLEAPAPSTLRPGLPPAVDALVAACLRKQPEARPGLEQVMETLTRLLDEKVAPAPGRGTVWAGVGAAAVVLALGAAGLALTRAPAPSPPVASSASPERPPASEQPPVSEQPPPSEQPPASEQPSPSEPPELVDPPAEEGDHLVKNRERLVQAIEAATQALRLNPRDARALCERASARQALGQWSAALADYERAIALDPGFARAYHLRGVLHVTMGHTDRALADHEQALALEPQNPRFLTGRGHTHARRGAWEQAIADYDRALELAPGDAAIRWARAGACDALGRREEAIAEWKQALDLEPQGSFARPLRGLLTAAAKAPQGYPAGWWQEIPREQAWPWEVLPQNAGPGEVILSKRTQLGLFTSFATTPFTFHERRYASMLGFEASLRYPEGPSDPRLADGVKWSHTREEVAGLTGLQAHRAGERAEDNMRALGIGWVSFQGERIEYLGAGHERYAELVEEASLAKLRQDPQLERLLLSTGDLRLRPDYRSKADTVPASLYCEVWTRIRARLRAERE